MIKSALIIAGLISALILGGIALLQGDQPMAPEIDVPPQGSGQDTSEQPIPGTVIITPESGGNGSWIVIGGEKDRGKVLYLPPETKAPIIVQPGATVVYVNSAAACCPSSCPPVTPTPPVLPTPQPSPQPLPTPQPTPIPAPQPVPPSQGCYDSDGGDNPEVKGEVKMDGMSFVDECTTIPGEIEQSVLTEYFCIAGDVDSKQYVCENGCGDGVCAPGFGVIEPEPDFNVIEPAQPSTCIDTEEDIDYFTKGTVQVDSSVLEDVCVDQYTLFEIWCNENNIPMRTEVVCEGGCIQGEGRCNPQAGARKLGEGPA